MDIFEKQETIETIKTIVKARWFYVSVTALQGIIIKIFNLNVAVPNSLIISLLIFFVFLINFNFWLYLRRPLEKITDFLKIIKFSQIPLELGALAVIFYFSGTANKVLIIMCLIPIMVASAIYKPKGIILTSLSTLIIYDMLVFIEYIGLMPPLPSDLQPSQLLGTPFKGNLNLSILQVIFFNLYIIGATFYAGYLAGLLKKREKRAVLQRNELFQKSQLLHLQTEELTKTKNLLQEALVKSDASRIEAQRAKEELEKTNQELREKIIELEKFYRTAVGRELKMIELKEEVKSLEKIIKKLKDEKSNNKI